MLHIIETKVNKL